MIKHAHQLDASEIADLLQAIQGLSPASYQLNALRVVLNAAPHDLVEECLSVARQLNPGIFGSAAIAEVAGRSDAELQRRLIDELLSRTTKQTEHRAFCIVYLLLPAFTRIPISDFAPKMVELAGAIENQEERIAALANLIPFLSGDLQKDALNLVGTFLPQAFDPRLRTYIVSHLHSVLSRYMVSRALTADSADWFDQLVHDRGLQLLIFGWADLWADLDADAQQSALLLTLRIPDMQARADALRRIAKYLTRDLRTVALHNIYEVSDISDRAQLLAAIAPYVASDEMDDLPPSCTGVRRCLHDT